MTIEEAIQHCKEVAKESREAALTYARENAYETAISCKACGHEHEQLAEWLTELKQRREAEISAPPKTNADRIRQMTDEEIADMLNIYEVGETCQYCANRGSMCNASCYHGILKWLKQEAEDDADD